MGCLLFAHFLQTAQLITAGNLSIKYVVDHRYSVVTDNIVGRCNFMELIVSGTPAKCGLDLSCFPAHYISVYIL